MKRKLLNTSKDPDIGVTLKANYYKSGFYDFTHNIFQKTGGYYAMGVLEIYDNEQEFSNI